MLARPPQTVTQQSISEPDSYRSLRYTIVAWLGVNPSRRLTASMEEFDWALCVWMDVYPLSMAQMADCDLSAIAIPRPR